MTRASRLAVQQLTVAAALGAAIAGGVPATADAAELGPGYERGAGYGRTTWPYRNWRERCAYAGHYCLYAEYGYVYHYPFDDRPHSPRFRFRYR
jgi:hypothetical protein